MSKVAVAIGKGLVYAWVIAAVFTVFTLPFVYVFRWFF